MLRYVDYCSLVRKLFWTDGIVGSDVSSFWGDISLSVYGAYMGLGGASKIPHA